ncbi:family 16 glycoside hydrolase [Novipirellula caenicola]|uniref:PhoD-like phosphatase n=1 Tax=Novipirellula caenicola TaxID=1536901 RepID=A0ABP9W104_9BACT
MRLFGLVHCLWLSLFTVAGVWSSSCHADEANDSDDSAAEQISLVSPEDDWSQPSFWRTGNGKPVGEAWEFAEGEVRLVKPRTGDGNLLSPPLPPNFELAWDWKISPKTNSGLKYRVRKFGNRYLGVEYQIIDEAIPLKNPSNGSTAAIYDLQAPVLDKPLKPAGQWNHARVVVQGTHLQHFLNGKLVAETSTVGTAWDAIYARSKFYVESGFAQPREGDRVMLTDHGGKAAYKNFQLTILPAPSEAPVAPSTDGPFLANGMRNGWADQDSIVLWTRTTQNREAKMDGLPFVKLSNRQARELAQGTDANELLAAQLPAGAELDQMLGACPGAAGEVRLTYFPKLKRYDSKTTAWTTTNASQDFTAQWHLKDLRPGTEYAAIVETRPVGSNPDSAESLSAVLRGTFETAPEATSSKDVRFCMTTCHDFIRRDDGDLGHKIYPAFEKISPDFVVHAGDIEYYDKPDPWAMTKELMRFKWQRIFALPNNRRFYANHTTYFIKDDHDTLKNDCWPGARYGSVSFEEGVQLFNEEQFPSHQPRYKTVSWGKHAQIWVLEGRDFRSPNTMPDGPEKTILGKEQKDWLLRTLKESDATFKLLFSPTPIVGPDRDNKSDNHANDNFVHEGDELRRAFAEIDGLIIFCGDRHWQYASLDKESGLWEFGCGPGSADHELGWKPGDKRPTHQFLRVAGGFLSGQVKAKGKDGKPELTLRHHEVNGKRVSEFRFPVKE